MICPFCGSEVAEGNRFCVSCGADLAATSDTQTSPQETAPQQEAVPAAAETAPVGGAPGADANAQPFNAQAAAQAMEGAVPTAEQAGVTAAAQAFTGSQLPADSPYAAAQGQQAGGSPYAAAQGQQPAASPYGAPGATGAPDSPYGAAGTPGAPDSPYGQQPTPPAAPPTPPAQPSGGMGKRIGIIAAIVVVLAIVIGAFSCHGGQSGPNPSASGSAASSSAIDKSAFAKKWELVEGTTQGLEKENLERVRSMGLSVSLDLKEDGTGVFALFSNESNVTWEAKSSTEGTVKIDGTDMKATLKNNQLVLENNAGESMTFELASSSGTSKSSSSSSGSSSTASSSSSTSGSSASSASSANMQRIGNMANGYVQVPSNWVDRTSDYDQNIVDSTKMVYWVNPDTEYTSGTFGHFMFSQAIQMRTYPTSYTEITNQVVNSYNDKIYGEVDKEETTFNGRKASIVTCSIPGDQLYLCNVIIDRDGNGSATVLMTLQGTSSTIEQTLSYAATWQPAS